jgi:acyl carrier protein
METSAIRDELFEIASEILDVERESFVDALTFDELDADSLDMLELLSAVEDQFHVKFDKATLSNLQTVGDVVAAIAAAQA